MASLNRTLALTAFAAMLPLTTLAQQQPTQAAWPQPVENNRPFGFAILDQNELRTGNGDNSYRWEGEGWYGDHLNRAWFKTEGKLDTGTGALDEAEAQALYSRAISRFFNLQAGARYNFKPSPSRGWGAFGVEGLAPLFWEIGAFGFVSNGGHYGARLEGRYDMYLTQRLVLQPQFELNFYSKSDPRQGFGAGLSDIDSGLRLRYEICRQFAPYVGVTYEKRYGQAATFARAERAAVEDLRFIAGIRVWW